MDDLAMVDAAAEAGPAAAARRPCLGYLVVPGAQKAGTTSLWYHVRQHPRIWVNPSIKEVEFFTAHHQEGDLLPGYHNFLRRQHSPAADLGELCPAPGSRTFRSLAAVGRRTCLGDARLWCQSGGIKDPIRPYAVSQDQPEPFYMADISPSYLLDPSVPAKVAAMLPEARVVILLRNPVKRVLSAFNQQWQTFRRAADRDSTGAYESAFAQETEWEVSVLRACYNRTGGLSSSLLHAEFRACLGLGPHYMRDSRDSDPGIWAHDVPFIHYDKVDHEFRRVLHSVYADAVERWFHAFPKQQLLVWAAEDFMRAPSEHLAQLVAWLGLEPVQHSELQGLQAHHVRQYRMSAADLGGALRLLREFFEPHNRRLFELLRAKGFGDQADRLQELWAPAP